MLEIFKWKKKKWQHFLKGRTYQDEPGPIYTLHRMVTHTHTHREEENPWAFQSQHICRKDERDTHLRKNLGPRKNVDVVKIETQMAIHFFENRETRQMQTTIDFYAHFEIPCIANRSVMDVMTIGTDQGKQNGRIKKEKKPHKRKGIYGAHVGQVEIRFHGGAHHITLTKIYLFKKKIYTIFYSSSSIGWFRGVPCFCRLCGIFWFELVPRWLARDLYSTAGNAEKQFNGPCCAPTRFSPKSSHFPGNK